MSSDQGLNTLYLVLLMVLVASSLVGMRLPLGKVVKMGLAWVAIFGVGFILFSFRSEFSMLGSRLRAEAVGTPIQTGTALRIPIGEDGHYWVDADVNGHQARFMVDSGATITTLSSKTASDAQVEPGIRVSQVSTANGEVRMRVASAERFEIGNIARSDFTVHINDHDQTNVLGMNFLSSLGSWRVEGHYMVLTP